MKTLLILATVLAPIGCTQPVPTPECIAAVGKNEAVMKTAISRGLDEKEADKLADKIAPISKDVCTDEQLESVATMTTVTGLI